MSSKSSKSITDRFIDDLYNMSQEAFPDRVRDHAKKCLIDYIGVTLAGSKLLKGKVDELLLNFKSSNEGVRLIGLNRRANLHTAVLINGLLSHAADFDDGVRFGMMHPGSPIISTLLPLAEQQKLNGNDLLRGIIIGYEASIRIARAIQPSHKELGFHATGTCGTIGAALGSAAMLKLSRSHFKNALSAAATSASGILKMIDDGSDMKPYNAGQAAVSGLQSVFSSIAGFNGPDEVLSGERGFLTMMSKSYNEDKLIREKNNSYCIEKIYMKPYAACRHSHSAIEAVLKLKSEFSIKPEDVEEIKIDTYHWAVGGHDHTIIKGANSAKMSTPFSVAVALYKGKANIQEFMPDQISNPDILELTKKIKLVIDHELTKLVPEKRAAIIEINTKDQQRFTKRVDYPKGEPENPITLDEIKEKLVSLSTFAGKLPNEADEITNCILNIEDRLDDLYNFL